MPWDYYPTATSLVAYPNVKALQESGLCTDRRKAFGSAPRGTFPECFRYRRGLRNFRAAFGEGATALGEKRSLDRAPRFQRRLSVGPAPKRDFGVGRNQRRGWAAHDHVLRDEPRELRSKFPLYDS